jgi:hypothetical protein
MSRSSFQFVMASRQLLAGFFAVSLIVLSGHEVHAKEGVKLLPNAESAQQSFITVKEAEGRTLFEIPASLLGKDMIWYVERGSVSASVAEGAGKGTTTLLIRLQKVGKQLFIRNLTASIGRRATDTPGGPSRLPTSDDKVPAIARSVAESALAPPLAAIPISSEGVGGSLVVDVTDLFRRNIPELSLLPVIGVAQVDPSRSYIEDVKVFPRNVLVSSLLTAQPLNGSDSVSAILKHSWTLLPDVPMKPRLADRRVGLFTVDFEEYASTANAGSAARSYVRRYRLEKKDPNAAISEPVKPIVYYIGRTVPEKWHKYVQQGVEDWQPAFEAAGFKNAIIAKNAPTVAEDPNWDPSDTRHSVIRWVANPVVNALGPNVADPRTGEILAAHIVIWEDVLKIANAWYYTMCSAVDKRAQTLPLSDELVGRMVRYIVSHEVGHTIGLRHNHRASTAYTVAQLRNPAFTAENGSTASIMAYGRMNYVAQPGDGVTPESLMPKVGPYDKHAIRFSYAQLPAAKEASTLEEWASATQTNPWLVYGGEDLAAMVDPQVLTQNIGKERVEATRLGLANLKIAMANLVPAYKSGASTFENLYDRWIEVLNVRYDYLSSVVKEVGGREERRSNTTKEPQYVGVSAARQKQALDFILKEGLNWDPVYYSSGVLGNSVPFNISHDLRKYQGALLGQLFDPMRLVLLNDALLDEDDSPVFTLEQYFGIVADGVFSEIEAGSQPSLLRRALHREFFDLVAKQRTVNPTELSVLYQQVGAPSFITEAMSSSLGTDTRAALRLTLDKLEQKLKTAAASAKTPLIRAHWEECLSMTRRLMN